MSKLRLMKAGHGDLCLAEWEARERDTVNRAADLFTEHRRQGFLAFRLEGPGQQTAIDAFDAEAAEILLVPPIRGG
jgi:hypothetical protein